MRLIWLIIEIAFDAVVILGFTKLLCILADKLEYKEKP